MEFTARTIDANKSLLITIPCEICAAYNVKVKDLVVLDLKRVIKK